MGYIHTIVRRQIAAYIDHAVSLRRNRVEVDFDESVCDDHADPENEMIDRERRRPHAERLFGCRRQSVLPALPLLHVGQGRVSAVMRHHLRIHDAAPQRGKYGHHDHGAVT